MKILLGDEDKSSSFTSFLFINKNSVDD